MDWPFCASFAELFRHFAFIAKLLYRTSRTFREGRYRKEQRLQIAISKG